MGENQIDRHVGVKFELQKAYLALMPGGPSQHQEVIQLFDERGKRYDILLRNLAKRIRFLKSSNQGVRIIDPQSNGTTGPGDEGARLFFRCIPQALPGIKNLIPMISHDEGT